MDLLEHYRSLALQGLDDFLREAPEAVLLRNKPQGEMTGTGVGYPHNEEETLVGVDFADMPAADERMVLHPLEKKKGAPFSDMITVGRTSNNDVVINDITVSRFHAYFKKKSRNNWVVCDAGSKNGTYLNNVRLEARKERDVADGDRVRIGDIEVAFQIRDRLFEILLHM